MAAAPVSSGVRSQAEIQLPSHTFSSQPYTISYARVMPHHLVVAPLPPPTTLIRFSVACCSNLGSSISSIPTSRTASVSSQRSDQRVSQAKHDFVPPHLRTRCGLLTNFGTKMGLQGATLTCGVVSSLLRTLCACWARAIVVQDSTMTDVRRSIPARQERPGLTRTSTSNLPKQRHSGRSDSIARRQHLLWSQEGEEVEFGLERFRLPIQAGESELHRCHGG